MKFFLNVFFCCVFITAVFGQEALLEQPTLSVDQATVPVMDFDELEVYLKTQNEKVLVINFWATWCAPCVEELHFFEYANRDFKDQDVKVILVSLDFKRAMDSQLLPFLERRGIQSEVILLSDPKTNTWIDRVATHWSGAIPGTWFISGDSAVFNEGKYVEYNDLKNTISTFQKL